MELIGMKKTGDSGVTRRELLKLSPLLLLGGFAVPTSAHDRLLGTGVTWSDRASRAAIPSAGISRPRITTPTSSPFERFLQLLRHAGAACRLRTLDIDGRRPGRASGRYRLDQIRGCRRSFRTLATSVSRAGARAGSAAPESAIS